MRSEQEDLYAVLGVRRRASAVDLRRAYDWAMSTRQTPERRAAVRRAYAVLGDPRMRGEYDRGRVVGVGAGVYFTDGPTAAKPAARRPSRLEQRWQRRMSGAPCPAAQRPPGLTSRRVPRSVSALVIALALGVAAVPLLVPPDGADAYVVGPAAPPALPGASALPAEVPAPTWRAAAGTCFSADGQPALRLDEPVPCEGPHLYEVARSLDLAQLVGRPVADSEAGQLAEGVCLQQFQAYTGLAGPTDELWPATMTNAGGGSASTTCLVMSRHLRLGTAAGLAG